LTFWFLWESDKETENLIKKRKGLKTEKMANKETERGFRFLIDLIFVIWARKLGL